MIFEIPAGFKDAMREAWIKKMESLLAAANKECEEQARLLGMSGSREAALLAQLDAANKRVEELEAGYEDFKKLFRGRMEYCETCVKNNAKIARLENVLVAAEKVMFLLSRDGAAIVPHLIDTDDNPGKQLRDSIAAARLP